MTMTRLTVVALLGLAAPALAQFQSGIEGTVYDQAQAAVPGAEVIPHSRNLQVVVG